MGSLLKYTHEVTLNEHGYAVLVWQNGGTSGAAWFLASKWRDICKWAKDKPFATITKTVINSDESTKRVYRFLTSEEIEDVARETSATTITTKTIHLTSTAAPPTP
jgi:hypothetical protein